MLASCPVCRSRWAAFGLPTRRSESSGRDGLASLLVGAVKRTPEAGSRRQCRRARWRVSCAAKVVQGAPNRWKTLWTGEAAVVDATAGEPALARGSMSAGRQKCLSRATESVRSRVARARARSTTPRRASPRQKGLGGPSPFVRKGRRRHGGSWRGAVKRSVTRGPAHRKVVRRQAVRARVARGGTARSAEGESQAPPLGKTGSLRVRVTRGRLQKPVRGIFALHPEASREARRGSVA